jgi:hypothetical protein
MSETEELMSSFVEAARRVYLPDDAILERATARWEYRKCRRTNKDKLGPGGRLVPDVFSKVPLL